MVAARYLPFAGGIETHIHETAPRMVAAGHQVTVVTADPTRELPAEENADGLRIVRVPAWPRNRDYYVCPSLYRRLSRGPWDIVHFQGYNTFAAPIGLLAAC